MCATNLDFSIREKRIQCIILMYTSQSINHLVDSYESTSELVLMTDTAFDFINFFLF